MKRLRFLLLALLLLCGCAAQTVSVPQCHLVLEDGEGFRAEHSAVTVRQGADAVFYLTPEDGYAFVGVDYADYTVEEQGNRQVLTLHAVRYSETITVQYALSGLPICYDGNGSLTADGAETVTLGSIATHLRSNTAIGIDRFSRAGYTLYGWNTAPDGSGLAAGLGSRVTPEEGLTLYAQWEQWTDADCFTVERNADGLTITGCTASGETLCIPETIDGEAVTAIAADACANLPCRTVLLPHTLRTLEAGAFRNAAVETLYLSDSLESVSADAFSGCDALTTLHINAATLPRYSGTYFDTFPDKYDRLLSLAGEQKLILFSGSSTRFGYDSAALAEAFPEYAVVNMGVFAYTNALPQLELIRACAGEGDILLDAPEFDAAKHQFCTTNALDYALFAMTEGNYDILAALDLREYSGVFAALGDYLSQRAVLPQKSWQLSAASLDEDGNPVRTPSYNEYGDYIVSRPNAASDDPVYDVRTAYTPEAFPEETFLAPLNRELSRFLADGVTVFFTYAPRNSLALTEESTPEARSALDAWLRGKLVVPVISEIEESLYPGRYLYGTDNHLSTEGVQLRTARILADLRAALS